MIVFRTRRRAIFMSGKTKNNAANVQNDALITISYFEEFSTFFC